MSGALVICCNILIELALSPVTEVYEASTVSPSIPPIAESPTVAESSTIAEGIAELD